MKPLTRLLPGLLLAFAACAKKPPLQTAAATQPQVSAPDAPQASSPTRADNAAKIKALIEEAFKPIYFPYDQATLSDASKSKLAEAGKLMQQEPVITVTIAGSTDERGTEEYNLALGEKRARTVMDYLVSYGVAPARLHVISYGKEKPVAPGHDEHAWALNRRAEFGVNTN